MVVKHRHTFYRFWENLSARGTEWLRHQRVCGKDLRSKISRLSSGERAIVHYQWDKSSRVQCSGICNWFSFRFCNRSMQCSPIVPKNKTEMRCLHFCLWSKYQSIHVQRPVYSIDSFYHNFLSILSFIRVSAVNSLFISFYVNEYLYIDWNFLLMLNNSCCLRMHMDL